MFTDSENRHLDVLGHMGTLSNFVTLAQMTLSVNGGEAAQRTSSSCMETDTRPVTDTEWLNSGVLPHTLNHCLCTGMANSSQNLYKLPDRRLKLT